MAAMSRLLPMMALSTFAVFLLVLIATPANALSNVEPHMNPRGHDSVAKRKRNALKRAKRCRPKSTSLSSTSVAPVTTSKSKAAYTQPPTTQAATSTTTTSKAVTTSAAPPSTGGGGSQKMVILAWPNGPDDLPKWQGKNVMGVYSWSPSDPNAAKIGVPFYPMLWGFNQETAFAKSKAASAQYCMFLNEPNQFDQSNVSVDDAVKLYWSKMAGPRQQGCKIVSPATTSAPSGLQWLKAFEAKCTDCFDIVAIHWYDVDVKAFQDYVTKFHTTFNKPVWITEFACQNFNNGPQCTKDQTWGLHTAMAKWAKDTPWVEGIAPFGAMRQMQGVNPDNQLMDPSTGKPNDLGQFWINGNWD